MAARGQVVAQGPTLAVPIRTQDTVVGVVQLQKPDAEWTDREVEPSLRRCGPSWRGLERTRLRDEQPQSLQSTCGAPSS